MVATGGASSLLDIWYQIAGARFTYDVWAGNNDGFPYRLSLRSERADQTTETRMDNTPLRTPVEITLPAVDE